MAGLNLAGLPKLARSRRKTTSPVRAAIERCSRCFALAGCGLPARRLAALGWQWLALAIAGILALCEADTEILVRKEPLAAAVKL